MDFKTTKRDLEEAFTQIVNHIDEATLPDEATVNRFARLAGRLHQLADEEWMGEAEDFAHLAGELLVTVKKKDLESCVMLVESLQDSEAFCHRTFRE